MSDPGLRFTIEHCDYGFVGGGPIIWDVLARCRAIGAEVGGPARPIVLYTLVCDPTDAAAQERVARHYEEFAFLTATLVGSPDTVVKHLVDLDRAGAYGVLFALPDPDADVDYLFSDVLPRMRRAGLRASPDATITSPRAPGSRR